MFSAEYKAHFIFERCYINNAILCYQWDDFWERNTLFIHNTVGSQNRQKGSQSESKSEPIIRIANKADCNILISVMFFVCIMFIIIRY